MTDREVVELVRLYLDVASVLPVRSRLLDRWRLLGSLDGREQIALGDADLDTNTVDCRGRRPLVSLQHRHWTLFPNAEADRLEASGEYARMTDPAWFPARMAWLRAEAARTH